MRTKVFLRLSRQAHSILYLAKGITKKNYLLIPRDKDQRHVSTSEWGWFLTSQIYICEGLNSYSVVVVTFYILHICKISNMPWTIMNFIKPSNILLNSASFVEKNFPDHDPVFCPVSGFSTSDGHIQKIPMRMN